MSRSLLIHNARIYLTFANAHRAFQGLLKVPAANCSSGAGGSSYRNPAPNPGNRDIDDANAIPTAHAILIRNGRVAALNDAALAQHADHTIDADGCFITPGLIDAHVHLLMAGQYLSQLDLRNIRSREQFEAAIAARHAQLPPDQWLIAHGWSAENWGGQLPTKDWLTPAGDRPTVAYRMDLHAALVNDAVLRRCNLSANPPGGRIIRDAADNPTGLLLEAALWNLVNPLIPQPDTAAKRQHLLTAQAHAHAMGITAVGSMEYTRDVADIYQPLRDQLTLRCRITMLDRQLPLDLSVARQLPPDDPGLAIIGCKAFIDGTLGSRTARFLVDYADDPGNRGLLVELAASNQLHTWAHAVAAAGLSPSMHAIGDEAVRIALDTIKDISPSLRSRIEHAQHINPADLPRFASTVASMQSLHRADDGRYTVARLGSHRLPGSFAFRTLLKSGAILAFGSDWPVVTCDPLAAIRAAVTGLTLDNTPFQTQETLTPAQALAAYTIGSAYALQLDDAGQLLPGCLADITIFDRDPLTTDWQNNPPCTTATIVAGKVLYATQ